MATTLTLEIARQWGLYQAGARALGEQLPAKDTVLDALIGEAVRHGDDSAFVNLVFACIAQARPFAAQHLIDGAGLFEEPALLAAAAWHASGNLAAAVEAALAHGRLASELEAALLVVTASRGAPQEAASFPPTLLARARRLARVSGFNPLTDLLLLVLADLLDAPDVRPRLGSLDPDALRVPAAKLKTLFLDTARTAALTLLPEQRPPTVLSGYTLRRAVERVGRNDPCPCGSGKKYKKCCYAKDQQRLKRSSAIPGVTLDELREHPEAHLSDERLRAMRAPELVRLDPAQVPARFHRVLLDRLLLYEELDAALALLETVGYNETLHDGWDEALYASTRAQRADGVRRLLALRPDHHPSPETLGLGASLLLLTEPGPAIEQIERQVLAVLREETPVALVELAHELLASRYAALGVLVARGVMAQANPLDAEVLLERVLEVRDELQLGGDEALEADVYDRLEQLWAKPGTRSAAADPQSEELYTLRQTLAAKNQALTALRDDVNALQAALAEKTTPAATTAPTPSPTPAPTPTPVNDDSPELKALRERLAQMKADLKERHRERNQLRRELAQTHQAMQQRLEVESSKETPDDADAADTTDDEATLLATTEDLAGQPVRVPVFPRKFHDTLSRVPPPVARAALELIGRLAAGDSAAFQGALRLQRHQDVYRQKVGVRHRLLFRLDDAQLTVVALIHRHDLERTVRNL